MSVESVNNLKRHSTFKKKKVKGRGTSSLSQFNSDDEQGNKAGNNPLEDNRKSGFQ